MADITSNLATQLKLDETSGTTAADSSGNSRPGTYSGTFTLNQTGPGGLLSKGVAFDGVNGQVLLTSLNGILGDNATVAHWIKLDNASPTPTSKTGLHNLGALVSGKNTHYPWDGDGKGYFTSFRNTSNTASSRVDAVTLPAGVTRTNWHHLAITTTPGANGWTLYINGSAVTTATGVTGVYYDNDLWSLGGSSASQWLDGNAADFRVYTRCLSSDDIAALYNLGKPQNTVAPGITGDCIVGQTLSGTSGTWSDGSVNARKWQSATDGSGTGAADIGGATAADFTITESELEKYVRYGVQYSNSIGTTWAYSSWMGPIEAPPSLYRPRCPSFSLSLPTLSLG